MTPIALEIWLPNEPMIQVVFGFVVVFIIVRFIKEIIPFI